MSKKLEIGDTIPIEDIPKYPKEYGWEDENQSYLGKFIIATYEFTDTGRSKKHALMKTGDSVRRTHYIPAAYIEVDQPQIATQMPVAEVEVPKEYTFGGTRKKRKYKSRKYRK